MWKKYQLGNWFELLNVGLDALQEFWWEADASWTHAWYLVDAYKRRPLPFAKYLKKKRHHWDWSIVQPLEATALPPFDWTNGLKRPRPSGVEQPRVAPRTVHCAADSSLHNDEALVNHARMITDDHHMELNLHFHNWSVLFVRMWWKLLFPFHLFQTIPWASMSPNAAKHPKTSCELRRPFPCVEAPQTVFWRRTHRNHFSIGSFHYLSLTLDPYSKHSDSEPYWTLLNPISFGFQLKGLKLVSVVHVLIEVQKYAVVWPCTKPQILHDKQKTSKNVQMSLMIEPVLALFFVVLFCQADSEAHARQILTASSDSHLRLECPSWWSHDQYNRHVKSRTTPNHANICSILVAHASLLYWM